MNEQLNMLRFGMTVMKTNPELYKEFMELSLMEVAERINEMYDVEISKGMDMDMLKPICESIITRIEYEREQNTSHNIPRL